MTLGVDALECGVHGTQGTKKNTKNAVHLETDRKGRESVDEGAGREGKFQCFFSRDFVEKVFKKVIVALLNENKEKGAGN